MADEANTFVFDHWAEVEEGLRDSVAELRPPNHHFNVPAEVLRESDMLIVPRSSMQWQPDADDDRPWYEGGSNGYFGPWHVDEYDDIPILESGDNESEFGSIHTSTTLLRKRLKSSILILSFDKSSHSFHSFTNSNLGREPIQRLPDNLSQRKRLCDPICSAGVSAFATMRRYTISTNLTGVYSAS